MSNQQQPATDLNDPIQNAAADNGQAQTDAQWPDGAGESSSTEANDKPSGDALLDEIDALRKERDEYLRDLQRLQAEFENYRKRMLKERSEMKELMLQDVITRLLDVVDNLERALDTDPAHENAESFKSGVKMIHQQLNALLAEQGLERIEAVGRPFDPRFHEAVMQQPSADHEPGTVLAEFQPGYRLKDRVLRASKVQVSQAAPGSENNETRK